MPDIGPTPPPDTRDSPTLYYWHLVVITGDLEDCNPPPVRHLVVTTESERYTSYWNTVLITLLSIILKQRNQFVKGGTRCSRNRCNGSRVLLR